MATNPRKRQQKLERKAAKRKEKKHMVVREQSAGLPAKLMAAQNSPILHTWVMEGLWEQGMGQALFSREMPNGSVVVAVFLVDAYCLGIKDAFAQHLTRLEYDEQFVERMQKGFEIREVSPACFRKIVEGAAEYAREAGFAPHPDYQRAKLIFGSVDPKECTEEFTYGKDGKPFFIAGPDDKPARCRQILKTLMDRFGPKGFHYMIPMADPEEFLLEGLPPSQIGELPLNMPYFHDDDDEYEDDDDED